LLAAPVLLSQSTTNDLGQALCLGLFGIGFNLIFRYSGLLSFGHAAFFGFAAYLQAKLFGAFPSAPLPLLLLATCGATCVLGIIVGRICVQRSGAYFSMVTLAVAAFIYSVAFKWISMTGGTDGLGGFMPAQIMLFPGWSITGTEIQNIYFIVLAVAIPVVAACWILMEATPFGNAVNAVRQNEERATFLGYNVFRVKLANFTLGATIAGVAGTLWTIDNSFVATDSIDLKLSTTVIIFTMIGGSRWFLGPVIGSIVYITLSDWLSAQTAYWQIWLGLAFIGLVLAFPSGIAGFVTVIYRYLLRRGARP
jgi:branched-chain amino acid transport system permease protein